MSLTPSVAGTLGNAGADCDAPSMGGRAIASLLSDSSAMRRRKSLIDTVSRELAGGSEANVEADLEAPTAGVADGTAGCDELLALIAVMERGDAPFRRNSGSAPSGLDDKATSRRAECGGVALPAPVSDELGVEAGARATSTPGGSDDNAVPLTVRGDEERDDGADGGRAVTRLADRGRVVGGFACVIERGDAERDEVADGGRIAEARITDGGRASEVKWAAVDGTGKGERFADADAKVGGGDGARTPTSLAAAAAAAAAAERCVAE